MKNQNENDVKKAIREYLEDTGWTVFRINNGGVYNAKRKKFIFHGKAGFSDLVAIKKRIILFIETKAPGKKLSSDQEKFLDKVNGSDIIYGFPADSFDAFKEEMEARGL